MSYVRYIPMAKTKSKTDSGLNSSKRLWINITCSTVQINSESAGIISSRNLKLTTTILKSKPVLKEKKYIGATNKTKPSKGITTYENF